MSLTDHIYSKIGIRFGADDAFGNIDAQTLIASLLAAVARTATLCTGINRDGNAMKKIQLALILCGLSWLTAATADEAADRTAVVDTVQAFFDAMTERDADAMRSILTLDGIFYGYREGADGLMIARTTHKKFIKNLVERDRTVIERFWDPQVLLHGRMAAVWAPYDLYVDGEFSHCGIDNFNFLNTDEGWKITGVVFSMEADDCAESPLGPLQN